MKYGISLIVVAVVGLLAVGCSKHANQALYNYLGNPVAPPAGIDAAYTKAGLTSAVEDAAQATNISLTKVVIDDSEFPFLVGVVCADKGGIEKLEAQLRKTAGYTYSGSVNSDNISVMDITPYKACPMSARQQIDHRLMLREAVFYDKMSRNP
jgi:hypothetical protein